MERGNFSQIHVEIKNRLRSRSCVTTFDQSTMCWTNICVDVRMVTPCQKVMLEVKNRFRSRTHVTTFKFQNALDFKNRLRCLSHVTKIRVLWIHDFIRLKNRLRSRTRVATFKFQSALDLKNGFRSRARATTYMLQSAVTLKNRLRSRTRVIHSTLNLNMKSSQNGIWCSGTRKWIQRYEIDHFCQGHISAIRPPEIPS